MLALAPSLGAAPSRVASLNLCTDAMLFELLPAANIVSITHLSRDPDLSPFHAQAAQMTVNRGEVEEVLATAPDLVVTGARASGLAEHLFETYGIAVLHLPTANDFAAYRENLRRLAAVLGVGPRAESLLGTLDRALAAAPGARPDNRPRRALLYQPNGYTPGRDSLMSEILRLAGYDNLAIEHGYTRGGFMSLESVLMMQPDFIVFSSRDTSRPSLAEEQLDHPALRAWTTGGTARSLRVPERAWTCAGAFNTAALDALSAAP